MMATELVKPPIQLGYKDMIDMALGSTDIGQFNLHLLHTILRCMVVHLNLDSCTIEYSGTQGANIENFLSNRVSLPKQTNIEKKVVETVEKSETAESINKSESGTVANVPIMDDNLLPQIDAFGRPILIVTDHDTSENASGSVGIPGKMVERSIPNCNDLLAQLKCKSAGNQNILCNMVDLVNLSERMTAAEIAIEKLSSVFSAMTKNYQKLSELMDEKTENLDSLLDRLDRVEYLNDLVRSQLGIVDNYDDIKNIMETADGNSDRFERTLLSRLASQMTRLENNSKLDSYQQDGASHGTRKTGASSHDKRHDITSAVGSHGTRKHGKNGNVDGNTDRDLNSCLTSKTGGVDGTYGKMENDSMEGNSASDGGGDLHTLISKKPGEQMYKDSDSVVALFIRSQTKLDLDKLLDNKKSDLFKEFNDMFKCAGGIVTEKQLKIIDRELLRKLHLFKSMVFKRLAAVECDLSGTQKQVKHINDNVEDLLDGFEGIWTKLNHFGEFEKNTIDQFVMVKKNINCLMSERQVRQRQIYDLIEAIELVKTVKANQEELDAVTAQKADKDYVDSKVSIKKFNIVQNDLACSVIQTMEKNTEQDTELHNAMKKVDCLLDLKVNRSEQDYRLAELTKRIDEVTDKMSELIRLRVCPEGAGTLQYMSNVRCITCNDVVSMKMNEPQPIPCARTVKAKQQRVCIATESNNKWIKRPKLSDVLRSRYCGGEYTKVDLNEKVLKKSDFYVDANVCPPALNSVMWSKGNDGAFYRTAPQTDCPLYDSSSSSNISCNINNIKLSFAK